jgi:hypothetical protein
MRQKYALPKIMIQIRMGKARPLSRNRRILLGALVALLGTFLFGVNQLVAAQDGDGERKRTIEVESTQYIWHLITNATGAVVCEVIVEHPGTPTRDEMLIICGEAINPTAPTPTRPPGATPQPTPQPFNLDRFLRTVSWRLIETRTVKRTVHEPLPEIMVNIIAPEGPLTQPYVILQAYEPVLDYQIAEIRGTVSQEEFICPGTPCRLTLLRDSLITFWAVSTSGDESERTTADVRFVLQSDGYHVTIVGITPFPEVNDSCADIWGVRPIGSPRWASFPGSPAELNTEKSLYHLANQLMRVGIVDAADCPGGGYFTPNSPNACGMERSREAMITWQNQLDPVIFQSAYEFGVPPRIIKTLIERESQFWPGNSRFFILEFGLSQMNQLGADVALRYDRALFERVCSGIFTDCRKRYASLPFWMQATLRGGLMRIINAECPTCDYGIDLVTTQQSVPIITQTLRANCRQVKQIIDTLKVTASYEDLWRFTLVSYNGGYACLMNALSETQRFNEPMTWDYVVERLACVRARGYVGAFWDELTTFDRYTIPLAPDAPMVTPVMAPTPVPTPLPTPVLSNSTLRVVMYVDRDTDGEIDQDERVDGVTVIVRYVDGTSETKTIRRGEALFQMVGKPINSNVSVNVPSLYRIYRTQIPAEGEVLVVFRLEEPPLPPLLP